MKNKILDFILDNKRNKKFMLIIIGLFAIGAYFSASLAFQYASGTKIYVEKVDVTDSLYKSPLLWVGFALGLVAATGLAATAITSIKLREKNPNISLISLIFMVVFLVVAIATFVIVTIAYYKLGL